MYPSVPYPGRPDGRFPVSPRRPFLEPLSTLNFVAAITSRIKLGTSVLIIPMRNPVLTAKQLATLDLLSEGRFILGAGTGWLPEEFEALNAPFRNRGPRMDEYLEVIRCCWTQEEPSYRGSFYTVRDVGFAPKPIQKPYPPIWIGGFAEKALQRAGRLADGYHAFGPPEFVAGLFDKVRRYANEVGRDPDSMVFSVRVEIISPKQMSNVFVEAKRYRQIGASHLLLAFNVRSMDVAITHLEQFAEAAATEL